MQARFWKIKIRKTTGYDLIKANLSFTPLLLHGFERQLRMYIGIKPLRTYVHFDVHSTKKPVTNFFVTG